MRIFWIAALIIPTQVVISFLLTPVFFSADFPAERTWPLFRGITTDTRCFLVSGHEVADRDDNLVCNITFINILDEDISFEIKMFNGTDSTDMLYGQLHLTNGTFSTKYISVGETGTHSYEIIGYFYEDGRFFDGTPLLKSSYRVFELKDRENRDFGKWSFMITVVIILSSAIISIIKNLKDLYQSSRNTSEET